MISDEDKALFRETMKAVTPLREVTQREPAPVIKKPFQQPRGPAETPISSPYSLSNYYQETVSPSSILHYCSQDLPHKRLRELKNGEIRWEGRLDLHGLKPDAARDALCHFIDKHWHMGHRCLLIIHGKGGRHDEEPVLKNLVNHWLPQLPQVLAFHSARPQDGGSGAVYVLLKRQRE